MVAQLEDPAEGVLYADIDLNEIDGFRERSPYLRDRRPDLYDLVLLP